MNEKNKSLFIKNPKKYLPEFGGYGAYGLGMVSGVNESLPGKYPINPKTFKIIDHKLYLFYSDSGHNFLKVWELNENENLQRVNERWKILHGKN